VTKSNTGVGAFFHSFSEYNRFNGLDKEKRNIVFYSESGQDWHHLRPYVLTIAEQRAVTYVTSDRNDPAFEETNPNLTAIFIKNGFWLITFFKMCAADICVLTMIDLESFHVKRSIYPVHYIYLFHAMGSTHMVDFAESYDHYDTILCSGPHQIAEIRAREENATLPAKNLIPHGYARIEQIAAQAKSYQKKHDKSEIHVLVAPTWGPNSILNTCGEELVDRLIESGFHVTLRPHWQTVKLTPQVVDKIVKKHRENTRFSYETRMGDNSSLLESDILICDWSSTSIEYALGLEQPVLYIDVPKRVRNDQYEQLRCEPLEIRIRSRVGTVLSPSNLSQVNNAIRTLVENPSEKAEEIRAIREEILYNFGRAVPVGSEAICELADQFRGKGSAGATPQ